MKEKSPRKPEFSWDFVDWERCSANCGPGEQISRPRCLEKLAGIVDETHCKNIIRPEEKVRPCYRAACLPRLASHLRYQHTFHLKERKRQMEDRVNNYLKLCYKFEIQINVIPMIIFLLISLIIPFRF